MTHWIVFKLDRNSEGRKGIKYLQELGVKKPRGNGRWTYCLNYAHRFASVEDARKQAQLHGGREMERRA